MIRLPSPVFRALALAVACALVPAGGWTAEARGALPNVDLVCEETADQLDVHRTLRALSFQLRGIPPTGDEYALVDGLDEVPSEVLGGWLESDLFADQATRRHRALFWPNVSNINLIQAGFSLRRDGPTQLYWRTQTATLYRGVSEACHDIEQTDYHPSGAPVGIDVGGDVRDGYVWVSPYWNPALSLKVCAFDAQVALHGLTGSYCGSREGRLDPTCGCGPDLRWCRYGVSHNPARDALGADLDRRVWALIREDASYMELFTGQRAFVNGPMVHLLTHQTKAYANVNFEPLPVYVDSLPPLAWTEVDTWVEIQVHPAHAGVLTSPAYLLRFQTNRARANRFFDAFLCQPFQAPEGGLPAVDEELPHPDLQQRDGCKYCHALLEPAAAHWGRWAEGGAGFLDPLLFPHERPDCSVCALTGQQCSAECNRFYLTSALSIEEEAYLGELRSYVFRRPEHQVNVEAGPALLATQGAVDGRLPRCVARRTAEWLLGRGMTIEDGEWVEDLAQSFVGSGFSYRTLVKSIVTAPVYRRVR